MIRFSLNKLQSNITQSTSLADWKRIHFINWYYFIIPSHILEIPDTQTLAWRIWLPHLDTSCTNAVFSLCCYSISHPHSCSLFPSLSLPYRLSWEALAEIQYSCYYNIAATCKLTGLSNTLGHRKTRQELRHWNSSWCILKETLIKSDTSILSA